MMRIHWIKIGNRASSYGESGIGKNNNKTLNEVIMPVYFVIRGTAAVTMEGASGMVALMVIFVMLVPVVLAVLVVAEGGGPWPSTAGVAGVRSSSLNSRK